MSKDNQIQSIEKTNTSHRKQIDLRESLVSLSANRHFKAVISEGYFKDEPVRLTALLGHPDHQTADRQAAILKQLNGVAQLHSFFNLINTFAEIAVKGLEEGEVALEELRAEELQGE